MPRVLCFFVAAVLAGHLPAGAGPVLPQLSGSVYVFAFPAGGPRLEVDPALGARISSLKLGTTEFLYVDKNQPHWGSTFWPSPQNAWARFTPQALDNGSYSGGPRGPVLVLTSAKDNETQLTFSKRLSADDADTSITVTLVMQNGGAGAKSWAPWQVTRVLPGGLTFFPKGPGGIRGTLAPQAKELEGLVWFDLAAATLPGGVAKFFADGEGWMAHVDKNGLMLLEAFPDIAGSQAAPEEAEIEVYAAPRKVYMEVEHQGAYTPIAAGDSTVWTTRWYLRQLPPGIPRTAGNPALIAYASSLARRATAVRPQQAHPMRMTHGPARTRPTMVYPVPASPPVDASGRPRLSID
jgi:hypothetical protein